MGLGRVDKLYNSKQNLGMMSDPLESVLAESFEDIEALNDAYAVFRDHVNVRVSS